MPMMLPDPEPTEPTICTMDIRYLEHLREVSYEAGRKAGLEEAVEACRRAGAAPNVYTKSQNLDTSQERVQKSAKSVHKETVQYIRPGAYASSDQQVLALVKQEAPKEGS